MSSRRKYKIAICDNVGLTVEKLTVKSLLRESTPNENRYEYIYALQDIADEVLDLKTGESMVFQPNRDDPNSKGIILRIE